MSEMNASTSNTLKFYSLSNKEGVFEVRENPSKILYGESINGIQTYCEKGDWVIIGNERIIHNIGKNIAKWANESYAFCIPVCQASNNFLEVQSPGSSYYSFTSINTGESVHARYLFEDTKWEIIFQIQNEQAPEIQILEANAFLNCFEPEDDESKQYVEYILRLFPINKNNVLAIPMNLKSIEGQIEDEEEEEWEIEARFPCDCYSHEMSFHSDDYLKLAEFGYWQRGRGEQPWGWKTRIKMIFDILTTGNPYSDMIILSRENVIKLIDTLNIYLEKTK